MCLPSILTPKVKTKIQDRCNMRPSAVSDGIVVSWLGDLTRRPADDDPRGAPGTLLLLLLLLLTTATPWAVDDYDDATGGHR